MKVICVKPFKSPDHNCENDPEPKVGDIDIVVNSKVKYGNTFYKLERFSGNAYRADHFATLPDSTADEMAEESREAIVNLETA